MAFVLNGLVVLESGAVVGAEFRIAEAAFPGAVDLLVADDLDGSEAAGEVGADGGENSKYLGLNIYVGRMYKL